MKHYNNTGLEYAIARHAAVNQLYDNYLPYGFHLKLAVRTMEEFDYLLPEDTVIRHIVRDAVAGHDLMEDARVSYNDLRKTYRDETADIIYAVTNEKGKTRKERASAKYYQGIRETEYADFVKMCDRIANVKYGSLFGGTMIDMYRKEQKDFLAQMGENVQKGGKYYDMTLYLEELLYG